MTIMEKLIFWFFIFAIGIGLCTGCASIPIPTEDVYEIIEDEKKVEGEKEKQPRFFRFKKVTPEQDPNKEILNAFKFQDSILLRAVQKEEGDLFIFAREYNYYKDNFENPTIDGFLIHIKETMMSGLREDIVDDWWTKVIRNYNLLLKMEEAKQKEKGQKSDDAI